MGKWQMATLEHVKAQTHGGTDSLWNLTMSCASCNRIRGSEMEAEEFYHLFSNKSEWKQRQAARSRVQQINKERRNGERQLAHNARVLQLAGLLLAFPGLYEYLMALHEHSRVETLRFREERRAAALEKRLAA